MDIRKCLLCGDKELFIDIFDSNRGNWARQAALSKTINTKNLHCSKLREFSILMY